MDTLCGIGLPELLILALLGFVVIGPERAQDVALRAGRFLRTVMRSGWWRDFNQVAQAMRDLPNTLVRMAELEEAQADIRRSMQEIEQEVSAEMNQIGQMGDIGSIGQSQPPIVDPWGIRNATAQTQMPKPAPPPTSPTEETPDA